MVRLGLSPVGAVQAATVRAAECLGRDDVGALEPGRLADLVAVPGHDLGDLSVLQSPSLVMKGGRVVLDRRRGRRPPDS